MRARVTMKDGQTTEIEAPSSEIARLAADPQVASVEILNEKSVARPWICGDASKPIAQA